MLNYWRTTAGATTFFAENSTPISRLAASPFSDYGFDGPFFDLVFTHHETDSDDSARNSSENDEEMREIDLNLAIDDQDFKISPLPSPSTNEAEENDSKFSHSLHKLLLKLKINKPHYSANAVLEKAAENSSSEKPVKLKGDEVKGPLISLFARDVTISEATHSAILGKETLQKYLNILKPLYVRVEKMKLAGAGGGGVLSPPAAATPYKTGARSKINLQAGLNFKVVRKHLGKSRSISAASPPQPGNMGSHRRDDSLLEVQDGIQGAILHCKRSFNASRDGETANYLGR